MDNQIYITLASDDNYAQHMGMVVFSVLANSTEPERIKFYLLDAGISATNRAHIETIVERHRADCEFIRPDGEIYANIPKKRYGVAALYRLSLGTLLPASVRRVIYLDCDVLAFDDIAVLWQMELGDRTVGAVTNLGANAVTRLGLDKGGYFNSGVLLIDMEKWRREQVGEKTLAYMNEHSGELIFPDQDGLNWVLKGKWFPLPLRWNQQPASYSMNRKGKTLGVVTTEALQEAVRNPGIVHYLGRNKPWNYMTFHPLKESYLGYLDHSPWHSSRPGQLTPLNRLKKAVMFEKHLKRLARRLATPAAIRSKGQKNL